nr:cyclic pyranopterin monophosphate synthase MoaC [uncultured Holophaga sp.]
MNPLTHMDAEGRPTMVDVSDKAITRRRAVAVGCMELCPACAEALSQGGGPKGDPWTVARLGAVGGVKRTSELIPLCHPLVIDGVTVDHHWEPETRRAWIKVEVSTEGRTGIEMEAIAGASTGLLVLYDMLKAVSHEMALGPVRLLKKEGGRRGTITWDWPECPWKA